MVDRTAVDAVMGRLFERMPRAVGAPRDRRRPSGSAGREASRSRMGTMARAASGRPAAVFKLIKSGGCVDAKGLKGQLDYVFSKSVALVDPTGLHAGKEGLEAGDIDRIARNWEQDWWGRTKVGYSSHMLLSYPIGTPAGKVRDITAAVCNEMFSSGDVRYKYIAGVHTDRDHPHAHIILNRRGSDGKLFTLRYGSAVSYQSIRDAMVAHGERHGVEMTASNRFERGLVHRPPTTREVYKAREQHRAPKDRVRVGSDLDFAKSQVDNAASLYGALGVLAERQDLHRVADVLSRANAVLNEYGPLPRGDAFMADAETLSEAEGFDTVLAELEDRFGRIGEKLDALPASERADLEKEQADLLADLASLNRAAPGNESLETPPGDASPYNAVLVSDPDRLGDERTVSQLGETLAESGIDPKTVLARVEAGNERQYLERQWMLDDLQNHAAARGLDLTASEEFQEARASLEDLYAEIRQDLQEVGAFAHDLELSEAGGELVERPAMPEAIRRGVEAAERGATVADPGERSAIADALRETLDGEVLQQLRAGRSDVLSGITASPAAQSALASILVEEDRERGHSIDAQAAADLRREAAERLVAQRRPGHGSSGIDHE
ncbi:relaxase/mobilization nuclease domain-containing protein [Tropicimonas isoalkanivorans]|uniref:Type IV secretion system T-DNA border endonuclease VirD2 n=1 Tax=Tropicimonas isoalkanivorans TaxID=441112 RepID=A0A1I1Q9D7_9RHOB|nr:relaxase/mobilization nuclease domain-containing protein [Tropicimonas isoalkanivorans]SFD14730.1 type IV secretion system T-DNA border endonuclease VirD2 [Tropicimonas isoalkanivorans]